MTTIALLKEIEKLPISERMLVVEKTLKSIRLSDNFNSMSVAAESLLSDYTTDKELTTFTNLDLEDFYESR